MNNGNFDKSSFTVTVIQITAPIVTNVVYYITDDAQTFSHGAVTATGAVAGTWSYTYTLVPALTGVVIPNGSGNLVVQTNDIGKANTYSLPIFCKHSGMGVLRTSCGTVTLELRHVPVTWSTSLPLTYRYFIGSPTAFSQIFDNNNPITPPGSTITYTIKKQSLSAVPGVGFITLSNSL